MFIGRVIISILIMLSLLACASGKETLALATEYPQPGGREVAEEMSALLVELVKKRDKPGEYRRDAHPKHHGCVKANFSVEPDLPEDLRVGLFQEARDYRSYIRFSNGTGMGPDYEDGVRGMAIKLTGVEGEKLLEDEKGEKTQDFLLISHNVLLVKDAADFLGLVRAASSGNVIWFFINPFDSHFREMGIFLDTNQAHPNLLDVRYFSTTPYLYGPGRAVKYSARPCEARKSEMPEEPGENFLRETMAASLSSGEACFNFMVQFQTDPYDMPIEDAREEWDEEVSPFRKVATVRIPSQEFESPEQMEFCENLSFTPWHSLSEHRPLGGVNRPNETTWRSDRVRSAP